MSYPTLGAVARATDLAHKYTDYFSKTNETIGPYRSNDLCGPTTGRYYDCTREWDTEIAIALAEEEFDVDLSRYEIANEGPWRDTVRSIWRAICAENAAEHDYQVEAEEA